MIVLKRLRVENFKLLEQLDITFPRQGAVLIEGLNESGKSTLFESIFFALYGLPLSTEGRGRGNLENLIHYGAESSSVRLWLEVDQVELDIQRWLRRGKPTQATLKVQRPGAPEEKVAGVQAVNVRVVDELGGLDAEALLNSCFVEQKKLSKLEDLSPAQRKESLRRLLNLDKLAEMAERFKVTSRDEQALANAWDRAELAEVCKQLPEAIAEKATLEERLGKVVLSFESEKRERIEGGTGRNEGEQRNGVNREREQISRANDRVSAPAARVSEIECDASRLADCRKSANRAQSKALALALGGLVSLAIVGGLILRGIAEAAWALPLAALPALAAFAAYRSAGQPLREAAQLEAKLALHRDDVVARIGELEGRKKRLEEKLGVEESSLDLEECRQEAARLARRLEVNRYAAELLEGTMERIVRLVLPNTERNMGQILPLLTAGRYHEARIASDYQIQVWDDTAGRYVSKNVFSGGAKDQFSLALRLAFALATLPQELGTTPGFIFLDEPISSFDGPRTEALIHLLTSGQIADSFNQIFVISHNRAFDAEAFQYRLVLREGRLLEGNLPVGPNGEE